jgi:hypothetical protein
MKTRIEVWVDGDFQNTEHVEHLRKLFEDEAWKLAKRHLPQQGLMVQANEIAIPLPSSGMREDYIAYKESQARCTST